MLQQIRALLSPFRTPVSGLKRFYGFILTINEIKDFLSLLATVAGLFGTGAATEAFQVPALHMEDWAFPVRLAVFLVLASGMGWALGALVRLLRRRLEREPRLLLSGLGAVMIAGMVAGCADWLGSPGKPTSFPTIALLIVLGTMVAARATVYSLGTSRGARAMVQVREASGLLLLFALASTLMLALSEMGVR